MKYCVLFLSLAATISPNLSAQQLVDVGPFGVPLRVLDEFGNWSIPIKVYSDPAVDVYVPDITGMGWKSWHAGRFRHDGTYVVQMVIFHKKSSYCLSTLSAIQRVRPDYQEACGELRYTSELLQVDTKKMTVETVMRIKSGEDASFHPELQSYPKATMLLSQMDKTHQKSIGTVSRIVSGEVSAFTGLLSP
jgi:hypothetical protein